jgi:hypothetical protein
MEGLIEAGAKGLGVRFTLVNFGPTALFVAFVLAHVFGGVPEHAPDLAQLVTRARQLDTVALVIVAVAILGISLIAEPLQFTMVQWLEGYWGRSLTGVAERRMEAHRRRRRTIEDRIAKAKEGDASTQALAWQLTTLYPTESRMMPTMLGNALRAAEDRPTSRYGLDAVLMWPRLYPLLSNTLRGTLEDRRNQLDIAARLCATLAAMTIVSVALLLRHGWWLAVPAATAALAWMSYRGAVMAAIAYGEAVQAAFDLHRFDLLRALHLALPSTREIEKATNRALCDFLRQGIPTPFHYEHPPASIEKD